MVVEHLSANGVMDPGLLYESPFSDKASDGPDAIFDGDRVVALFEKVRSVNEAASVQTAS